MLRNTALVYCCLMLVPGLPNLTHCQVIMQEPNIKFNSLTAAIQAAASDLSEPQGTTTRTAVTTEDNAKAAGAGMFVSGGSHTFAAIGVADGTITCSGENQPNEVWCRALAVNAVTRDGRLPCVVLSLL